MIRAAALFLALAMASLAAACADTIVGSNAAGDITINGVPIRQVKEAKQGALIVGQLHRDGKVWLNGQPIMVGEDRHFVVGFDRDAPPAAEIRIEWAQTEDQSAATQVWPLAIEQRTWDIQRIDGLPPDKVTPPPEALEQIKREAAQKRAARKRDTAGIWFVEKFIWPTEGRISGVFGSQRILNGEPRAPHYGLDIAAPEGTPIKAPAGGIVRLAATGFFYEGGLVFLDHGHGLVSYMMHMSRVDVKPGEEIKQGDVIGAVGKTGRVSGAHLHWGIFWLDAHIDPQLLLPDKAH